MAHPTAVPENFDPEVDPESDGGSREKGNGMDERSGSVPGDRTAGRA